MSGRGSFDEEAFRLTLRVVTGRSIEHKTLSFGASDWVWKQNGGPFQSFLEGLPSERFSRDCPCELSEVYGSPRAGGLPDCKRHMILRDQNQLKSAIWLVEDNDGMDPYRKKPLYYIISNM